MGTGNICVSSSSEHSGFEGCSSPGVQEPQGLSCYMIHGVKRLFSPSHGAQVDWKGGRRFFISWEVPSKGGFQSCKCQAVAVEFISCCWGGCGLLLGPDISRAGNRTLCVFPNLPDIASVPLPSVRLWEVPVTANSPPGKASSVVQGPLPPSSTSRAPSTSSLPRTAPSTSLWIVSSPSSAAALWSAQLGKSGPLAAPGAPGQVGWGPWAWESEPGAGQTWHLLGKA